MIRNLLSGIIIAIISTIITGCGPGADKKELSEEFWVHLEMLQEEIPVLKGSHIYNTDIKSRFYEEGEGLISARWGNMENMDQLLFAIRNSDMEGLRPEDYHLSAIENIIYTACFQTG